MASAYVLQEGKDWGLCVEKNKEGHLGLFRRILADIARGAFVYVMKVGL